MALKDEIPALVAYIEQCKPRLQSSKELLEIYENDLLKYIEAMFRREMGDQTYAEVRPRIPPINILIKIVDKLSQIYQHGVTRTVIDGTDEDQALVDWYVDQFDANVIFNQGNEFLNLDRINLMQPYYDDRNDKPALRATPNDRFLVFSNNKLNPLDVTHVMIDTGRALKLKVDRRRTVNKEFVDTWAVWTDDEHLIFDADGEIRFDLMQAADLDGTNPFGRLPFQYVNSSQNFLLPPTDSDTKRMTVLIPALFADVNYAAKFQSFSQIFVFNAQKENWTLAPNSVQFIDDKPGADSKVSVDVIKPEVDITEVVQLAVTELSMWMNSRSVKPGSMGSLSADNLASGVSKIIDEMDTSELREKQAAIYQRAEASFWDTVLNFMHPIWVDGNMVSNRHKFSPNARVLTEFTDQRPSIDRSSMVSIAVQEINSGLKSRETVMAELNPDWSEERIDQEIALIDGIEDGLAEDENSN